MWVWLAFGEAPAPMALLGGGVVLAAIVGQPTVGIAQTDLDGRFVLVNERYGRLVGRAPDEVMALSFWDTVHAEDRPRAMAVLRGLTADAPEAAFETRHARPDGSLHWVDVSLSLAHEAGEPRSVAIVTDGTAVLGLGDIGPEAAMPVMEGKAMLFKSFGEIDAWPICLDTKDTEEIIMITKAIAPGFGGILLEDISAPRCFEIEDRLRELLDIPVFHDDQHGTAVVVLAAFINALKVVGKRPENIKMVLTGVGASGVAVSKILMNYGVKNIIGFDRTGAVYKGRTEGMNFMKEWFADNTNLEGISGSVSDAMEGADLFLSVHANASGGPSASRTARSSTARSSSASGTALLMRPHSAASTPVIGSPSTPASGDCGSGLC